MGDDSAILNEIYQEMYAMRSRMEYMNEIYQEVYAMRSKTESLEGLLKMIHGELAAIRRGFGVQGGAADQVSTMQESTSSKSRFNFFKR
ncbi:hypothetical protein ACFLRC_03475 [Candidatus Altiarchaeota archaeon]